MKEFLAVTAALNDSSRLRALLVLKQGELCVCQLIELLQLSPSTVSRHMSLLHAAGLIEQRKQGRWHYYRLPTVKESTPLVRQALALALKNLEGQRLILDDQKQLCCVRRKNLKELTSCYSD